MDKLLGYINSLPSDQQTAYAERCGTTLGYLRKACSRKQMIREGLCARLSAESGRVVSPEDIRPDVDWAYLRLALADADQAIANTEQAAPEPIANPDALRTGAIRRNNLRRGNDLADDTGRREQLPDPVFDGVVQAATKTVANQPV